MTWVLAARHGDRCVSLEVRVHVFPHLVMPVGSVVGRVLDLAVAQAKAIMVGLVPCQHPP